MLQYLKQESNKTFTENGAATLKTTQSDCLDLFATVGAIRRESDEEITTRFMRAFAEDKDIAMKLLFFARDIRGGLGERKVFRVSLRWLAKNAPETVRKNLSYIAEYGRFDDLIEIAYKTPLWANAIDIIKEQLAMDISSYETSERTPVSLLAKWMPSENTSSKKTCALANDLRKALKMSHKQSPFRLIYLSKNSRAAFLIMSSFSPAASPRWLSRYS